MDLLGKTAITHLVESSGINLSQDGDQWKGHCPFHDDSVQSLQVDPAQNTWRCDVCEIGGSTIEWVMQAEGISRSHAVALLRSQQPLTPLTTHDPVKHSSVRRLDAPFTNEESDQQILQHVVNYYHETLKQSPRAMAYLKKRGLVHRELVEHFKLGFSDRTLGYRLPEKNRKEGAALRGRLQRLGIIKASGHETFRGSLVVPIGEHGVVQQLYGHKITEKLRPGTSKHCYLPAPEHGFFNAQALSICEEMILCPSIIDALTFWCAGYRNVVSYYGTEQLTQDELDILRQSPVKRVLLAHAGTQAGDKAANIQAEQLKPLEIATYRLEFTGGMDANDYALAHPPAHQSLGEVIRKAVWLGQGKPPDASVENSQTVVEPEPDLNTPQKEEVLINADVTPPPEAETESQVDIGSTEAEDTSEENAAVLPATVLPPPASEIPAEVNDEEVVMYREDRRYRIRGLKKNLTLDQLKVNLLVNKDEALHVDTLDLYAARPRLNFIKQAALELAVPEETIKSDLGLVLLKLEVLQDRHIQQVLSSPPAEEPMTKQERADALGLLRSPDLLRRILDDYTRCGVVGEKTNKLVGYLAALSRKLDKPLAVIIQSTSAAGKSALMEAVLSFVPEEERMQYSAMTGQSLFYMGDINLKHKILAISEEEGASQATYALKLLQSEGQLTIASTCKDPDSGRHLTREYQVEGPVMIFSTTTAIDIDEELLNRCLVLSVDEDRSQTRAIHEYQRFEETLEGLQASQVREDILKIHRNAQRLIKPLKVVNPYAEQLTFLDDKTRTRRDHKKYLTLIRSIALLHQYQRETKTTYYRGRPIDYVEVTLEDIDKANQLAHEVLGRSLDELPPQTRRLLLLTDTMVMEHCAVGSLARGDYRFTRRDVRAYTGWGDTQLKVHLQRLEAMEYLLIHHGGRGRRRVYELLYNREGQDGRPFLMGLIDAEALKSPSTDRSGQITDLSVPGRLAVGAQADAGRPSELVMKPHQNNHLQQSHRGSAAEACTGPNPSAVSYRNRNAGLPQEGGRL